ncbi:hypothetical protein ANN_20211 [Periplaneta americana]|uniref:Uncharacterized protein n=1 Tax=Periplaneta americana TaxID=6978 RepID=A0ABQ8SCE3_PERAM|nr:hypothetical protein ANN_20211 [Periplaneta americana]
MANDTTYLYFIEPSLPKTEARDFSLCDVGYVVGDTEDWTRPMCPDSWYRPPGTRKEISAQKVSSSTPATGREICLTVGMGSQPTMLEKYRLASKCVLLHDNVSRVNQVIFTRLPPAADPAQLTEDFKWERADVSTHVKSQMSDLPLDQGINVKPSGRLPSDRLIPDGSRRPRRNAVAIWKDLPSIKVPTQEEGRAWSQDPDSFSWRALIRAMSLSDVKEDIRESSDCVRTDKKPLQQKDGTQNGSSEQSGADRSDNRPRPASRTINTLAQPGFNRPLVQITGVIKEPIVWSPDLRKIIKAPIGYSRVNQPTQSFRPLYSPLGPGIHVQLVNIDKATPSRCHGYPSLVIG